MLANCWDRFARSICLGAACLVLMTTIAQARAEPEKKPQGYLTKAPTGEGFHFFHHDWELACDNTRTCRAAGYHKESEELKVSVLLTRAAGPDTTVAGELKIGHYSDDPVTKALPEQFSLTMLINGHPLGPVGLKHLHGSLSKPQASALVDALTRKSRIEFVYGDHRWQLSDQGGAAILLRMDEFQGRLKTPGALLSKGTRSELSVRLAKQAPKVVARPLPEPRQGDELFVPKHKAMLIGALRATTNADDCPMIFDFESGIASPTVTAVRLTNSKMLLSALCWRAAYNEGMGYWVTEATPPFKPRLITALAMEGGEMELASYLKGRGPGDCSSSEEWIWNGKKFIHTHSTTTGMCRLIEPGGAWNLPVVITNVQR